MAFLCCGLFTSEKPTNYVLAVISGAIEFVYLVGFATTLQKAFDWYNSADILQALLEVVANYLRFCSTFARSTTQVNVS